MQGSWAGATTNYVGNPNDPNFWTHYWPHGGIHFYAQANGIFHAISFNPRLQQTESCDMLFNDPSHTFFVSCPNWGSSENPGVYNLCPHPARTPNNGNLLGYDEYHGGPGYPQFLTFHQNFAYDSLNRLRTVADSGGWSRTFNYDPFGNMWVSNVAGLATGAYTSGSVYDANNRIANTPYDAAGNLLVVNANALTYDAENRQVSVTARPPLPVAPSSTSTMARVGGWQRPDPRERRCMSTMLPVNWQPSTRRQPLQKAARSATPTMR